MAIRDLALTAVLVALLPACFLRPWIGILVWSWLSYMNPHRLTWGFAHDAPFAQVVAIATLAGLVFPKDRKAFIWSRETALLLALWAWFGVTSYFAVYPEPAWTKMTEVSKILFMALLSVFLFQDRAKLRVLLFVIAGSIAFYGVKGGVFALATGGQWMVLGPPGAFFSGNTELALVMNMCLPILMFLAKEEPRRWLRLALWAAFGLTALAVPFTYSRGGIIGLAVVLGMLFLKARTRIALVPITIAALLAFAWLAPSRWVERVETLRTYEQDESANLRLMSWRLGYALATDRPLTGGGFKVFVNRETYDRFMPEYPRGLAHEAHSIYFGLAGEHGWIGLGIFSALILCTLATLRQLRALGRRHEKLVWISNYGHMLQASIVAYLVTGIFLSVAYFDLAYQLMVIAIILKGLARREVAVLGSSLSSTHAPGRPVGARLAHAAIR